LRIKGSHLMHRRVRKIEPSCHVLLIPFLPMELSSHPLPDGLTLSSIFRSMLKKPSKPLAMKFSVPFLPLGAPWEWEAPSNGRGSYRCFAGGVWEEEAPTSMGPSIG
jgi:hypothetical protein